MSLRLSVPSIFVAISLLSGCASMPELLALGQQVERRGGAYDYLLYVPEGYQPERGAPLLLFLHGAGERGTELAKVKMHGPPKLIDGGVSMPFIVVSPLAPRGGGWDVDKLGQLLDAIESELAVDRTRVYVTGLSMGGFGAWGLAAKTPERFAAIVPICGGGDSAWGEALAEVPGIWAFHGALDQAVPLRLSEEMVGAVRAAGGNAKLTVYPKAGHDAWTETYDNEELYAWLLRHAR